MNKRELAVAVINHGCKLNQYEGETLENDFSDLGFRITDLKKTEQPDIVIVNTCTVTGTSDRKSRASIYKAIATKKTKGLVIVTGCYAQTDSTFLRRIEGVDFVIGNPQKAAIPEFVKAYFNHNSFNIKEEDLSFHFRGPEYPHRSRVYVKVQDGCNMSCSYCKVPNARGRSRSRPPEDVLSYVKKILENGYSEIVLTGINLGDYHYGNMGLSSLISKLLSIDSSFRIRLSSIEPFYFGDDLIDIISNNRIVPHFHIPMQSGANRILKLMNRPYDVDMYIELLKKIESLRPDCHFATDLIVGFPTERNEDFDHTLKLIRTVGFGSLHVFKYSPREGTRAFYMKDDVRYDEKAARSKELISVGQDLNYRYRMKFLGAIRDVIFEGKGSSEQKKDGLWEGITDNYIRVKLASPFGKNLERRMLPVRITEVKETCTYGEIALEP